MNDVKMHICPTCGGKLLVNTERQMYECPYCGGTFDYDYFREESVLGIAAQALTNNEFASASSAYEFLLEKEPDNFEALRGKALIAMDITKIDAMSRIDLYSKINHESACKEIDRAIGASRPQDREYFTTMKDMVDSGKEYFDEKAQVTDQKTKRNKTLNRLQDYTEERDTIFIYASSKIRPKKAVIMTVFCYIICCLLIFLVYKINTRNPYSKAEDLSWYETNQTDASEGKNNALKKRYTRSDSGDIFKSFNDYIKYSEALEREEQRKINYETWENNHQHPYANLVFILIIATFIYALVVLLLFIGGRRHNAEIAKIQAEADEQAGKIKEREERMAEIKGKIDQGYKRLCELHPEDAVQTK